VSGILGFEALTYFYHWRKAATKTYINDFDPRGPLRAAFLQSKDELLPQFIKFCDINLLHCVLGAILIDFMVNFVENPSLVVVN
jgi:hypothetical protein